MTILLFVSLFILIYTLTGPMPDLGKPKSFVKQYGISIISALAFFILTNLIFGTALAGMFWAVLGWLLPSWISDWLENSRKKKLRDMVKSFVAAASGLYGAGQTTPEVINSCAQRFPEPFSSEFQNMLGMRTLYDKATYPHMFRAMSEKYDLPEFIAVAAVVESAERSGGPIMASRGLKRLSRALRQRDRLLQERAKSNYESMLAAVIVLGILSLGLILDVTVLRPYFADGPGKIILALASGLIVAMTVVTVKTNSSKDLA